MPQYGYDELSVFERWLPPLRLKIGAALLAGFVTAGSLGALIHSVWQDTSRQANLESFAQIEADYQEKIARLRIQIDRLTSSQNIDRESVELQVSDLIQRQQALAKRHEIVNRLLQEARSNGIFFTTTDITPQAKPNIAEKSDQSAQLEENSSDANTALGGEIELIDDPVKALGLRGASSFVEKNEPARASAFSFSAFSSSSASSYADMTTGQTALWQVKDDLNTMQEQSSAVLGSLALATNDRIENIMHEAQGLGVSFDTDGVAGKARTTRTAVGGPYAPYLGKNFVNRARWTEENLARLARLKAMVRSLPVKSPLKKIVLTSDFGPRLDPFLGRVAMHTGMDFKAPRGTRVYATAPGTVTRAGYAGGYGKMVEIRHANGLVTRYAHMSAMHVYKGDKVATGDPVGNVGTTGRSTGPHLHYEVRMNGKAINPAPYVRAGTRLEKMI